ncbi:MAG: hypothetical protein ACFB21_06925 [Opitutales bacterium]
MAWALMTGALLALAAQLGLSGEMGVLGSMAIMAWLLSIFISTRQKSPVLLHNLR